MRGALRICQKDVRQRLRDRTALGIGLVAPLVLSALIGLALGGIRSGLQVRLALVDLDRTPLSRGLADSLRQGWPERSVVLEPVASESEAAAEVASGRLGALLLVPAGFARSVAAGAPLALQVRSSAAQPLAGRLARALARRFAARLGAQGPPPALEARTPGGRLRPIDTYAPSLAVMFLFFSVLGGMRAFQAEADGGTLVRLAAAPLSMGEILAGKIGALILLGALQFGVLGVATRLLFGVRWGPLFPTAALAATTVLAAVGVLAFVVSAVGNAAGGWVLGSAVVFVFSLLGGQFLPPEGLPDFFDTLARWTPNGQALRGFIDLAAAGDGATLALIREPLAVTGVVGAAGIAACALRLRRPRAPRG